MIYLKYLNNQPIEEAIIEVINEAYNDINLINFIDYAFYNYDKYNIFYEYIDSIDKLNYNISY